MNRISIPPKFRAALPLLLAGFLLAGVVPRIAAFPPAPYHHIYGLVRDKYGTPLSATNVNILLETTTGTVVAGQLLPGLSPGVNYEIKVPMDAGLTYDLYQPNALTLAAPFKIYVVTGTITNLPIQMIGNAPTLGQAGQSTVINLTLGTDANGDGIPDEWEQVFMAEAGTNAPLSSINANSVLTKDGRTLGQEFLLGDYPFDPGVQFTVTMLGVRNGGPVIQFPTMTGRSYTVLGSTDLNHWSVLSFKLSTDSASMPAHTFYYSSSITSLQVNVQPPAGAPLLYLRVMLQ